MLYKTGTNIYVLGDTQRRALFYRKAGYKGVLVAEIVTSSFTLYYTRIEFLEGFIKLNGWRHTPTNTILFSLVELRDKFHLDSQIV